MAPITLITYIRVSENHHRYQVNTRTSVIFCKHLLVSLQLLCVRLYVCTYVCKYPLKFIMSGDPLGNTIKFLKYFISEGKLNYNFKTFEKFSKYTKPHYENMCFRFATSQFVKFALCPHAKKLDM